MATAQHDPGVDRIDFERFSVDVLRDTGVATSPRQVCEDDVHRFCVDAC
jgi:hypothetical protein